jgi:hypothetical protein
MGSYRAHQMFVGVLLAFYVAGGCILRFARDTGEVFPVFAWTMFCYVPNTVTDYAVEILELNGESQQPPLPFHEARGQLTGAGVIAANYVILKMGKALEQGDVSEESSSRELFERHYLRGSNAPVRYRVIRRVYLPLEFRRSRELIESTPISEYVYSGGVS